NVDFGVAAFKADGSRDTSFGTNGNGLVTTNISTYTTTDTNNKRDSAKAIAVQDDGKIVVGGLAWTGPGTADAVLVRYNTNGSPDASFGSGGIVRIHQDNVSNLNFRGTGVWDIAIQRGDPNNFSDDKIVTFEDPQWLDATGNP